MIELGYTAGGLLILLLGAEGLVRGSSALAYRLGMRPLLIGMTVVAFGTSMPEMIVSVQAALSGQPSVSLGNVIGSNICNIGLILGLSALVRPLTVQSQTVRMDVPVMIGSAVLITIFLYSSGLSRIEGMILVLVIGLFLGYTMIVSVQDRFRMRPMGLEIRDLKYMSLFKIVLHIAFGFAGLLSGAHFFLYGAVRLAVLLGISETILGLTLVALGTSLPELATSFIASLHKESDLAVGNVIGSNIFNTLAILGVTSLVHPLQNIYISWLSIGSMLLLSILCLPFLKSGFRLNRIEGCVLLIIYVIYVVALVKS